ncbi:MAG: hypothetical protein DWC10_07295 [Candidatus Poseidoniales archaeon]|nr:MAG: hypothetical protein DWC10_07295 [Candidatus Poseidoniales archaeon]
MTRPSEEALRQGGSPPEGEDLEAWEAAQEAAKLLSTLRKEITPTRVAMAGAVLLLLITMTMSGWYWLLPRDAVTIETHYMQRGGHLMMTELHNDGSRSITDFRIDIEFQTEEGERIDSVSLELREMEAHSSISGDELEMMVVGYTVWDTYRLVIDVEYVDYTGELRQFEVTHEVGYWSQEIFMDKAERHTWPFN